MLQRNLDWAEPVWLRFILGCEIASQLSCGVASLYGVAVRTMKSSGWMIFPWEPIKIWPVTALVVTDTAVLTAVDGEIELTDIVTDDETCAHVAQTGSIDAVVEWEVSHFMEYMEYAEILMAPVVGQLTDDNGDGVIDSSDVPDIVVLADDGGAQGNTHGVMRLILEMVSEISRP